MSGTKDGRRCVALLLAGGMGSRLGSKIPKQFISAYGKPVIAYCLETIRKHPQVDGIWVVARKEWRDLIADYARDKLIGFSEPGETRQLSIWNGLRDMKERIGKDLCDGEEDLVRKDLCDGAEGLVVLIHDAARPRVTTDTLTACIEGCEEHDGVMPALPMKDTVYYCAGEKVESLLDRSRVMAGQAPEAFRFEAYYEANRRLLPDEIRKVNGSSEPAVMAGMDVAVIPGDEGNFKITTSADLIRFLEILEEGARRK